MKDAILIGKKVYLRALKDSDAEGNYPNWFNDPEVSKFSSHGRVRHTREMALAYIDSVRKSPNMRVFAIADKATDLHIGNVTLQQIDTIHHHAEMAIILGEKEFWGKGYAKEAWALAMEFGFKELGLHRLHCGTHEGNLGMRKLALACGMKEEGRQKEARWKDDHYVDIILFGCVQPG